MKNLLMIAFEFPPVNSTGCYRYLKFIRHLKKFGINPIVIAPTVESSLKIWPNRKVDAELERLIPSDIEIVRVPLNIDSRKYKVKISFIDKITNYLSYKDSLGTTCYKSIDDCIGSVLAKRKIDALFISLPPFSVGSLAVKISKKYNLPLLLDMRDDWVLNQGKPFLTFFHYYFVKKEIENVFKCSDAIVFVTEPLKILTKKIFSFLNEKKNVFVVTNGFDIDNPVFDEIKFNNLLSKDKIVIGYSGEFYFDPISHNNSLKPWWKRDGVKKINYKSDLTIEDWTYRSPWFFLKTIRYLIDKYPDLASKLRFEHIGNTPYWLWNWIKDLSLEDNFKSHGFVSKFKNLELQKSFDILLVTSEKVQDTDHYCISSKVFDAFLLQKPIWAFVTNGATKYVVEKSGTGWIFNPDDIESSADKAYDFLSKNISLSPDTDYLGKFKPEKLSEQLSYAINSLTDN